MGEIRLRSPALAATDWLTTGDETMMRRWVSSAAVAQSSQTLRLAYLTARKSETVTKLRAVSGTTVAGATPTLCRMGVWSVAANGDLALLAAIANDTTLFAAAQTPYTRDLTASFQKVAGLRYAFGILVVTAAAAPTAMGQQALAATEHGQAPKLGGAVFGQADLPAALAAAAVADNGNIPYGVLLP